MTMRTNENWTMEWFEQGCRAFLEDGSAFAVRVWNGSEQRQTVTMKTFGTSEDAVVLLLQFVMIHGVSWGGRYLLWDEIGRRYSFDEITVRKFSHNMTALFFHTLSAFFAYRIVSDKEWLFQQDEWTTLEYSVSAYYKFFYLLYAARYASDLVSLCFEVPKQDTWAYMVHHIVTILLVLVSITTGTVRIGGVFMVFLDYPDILLTAAKAFKYLSVARRDVCQLCADRLFEAFAVMFVVTRNVLFPYVVWVCLVISKDFIILKTLLVVLVLLMYYWLFLILKIALHIRRRVGGRSPRRQRRYSQS